MTTLNVAVTRIRAWVSSATTRGTNHYTITAIESWISDNGFKGNQFTRIFVHLFKSISNNT
jgi:hypothetical protein